MLKLRQKQGCTLIARKVVKKVIVGDNNVEQVTAFVCNLTSEYGDSPTEEQAESFARRERTLVSPKGAIEVLGVRGWEDVMAYYNREILKLGPRVKIKKDQRRHYARRYTNAQLIDILVTLWQEFDGKITQEKLYERAKHTSTPSWTTLKNRLGDPKYWELLIKQRLSSQNDVNANNNN